MSWHKTYMKCIQTSEKKIQHKNKWSIRFSVSFMCARLEKCIDCILTWIFISVFILLLFAAFSVLVFFFFFVFWAPQQSGLCMRSHTKPSCILYIVSAATRLNLEVWVQRQRQCRIYFSCSRFSLFHFHDLHFLAQTSNLTFLFLF